MPQRFIRTVACCALLLAMHIVCAPKKAACPCPSASASSCSCMAPSKILKMQTIQHGAPIRSVAWLCKGPCPTPPLYDLAAIGGYLSEYNVGPEGASVRVYEFNRLTEHFTLRDSVAPTSCIFSIDWCCVGTDAYLAVGGIPNHVTGSDVWIYKFNNITKKLDLVASFAHGSIVYTLKWLCIDCELEPTYRFLAIGGDPAPDNADIRLLAFYPDIPEITVVNNRTHGGTIYALDWLAQEGVRSVLVAGGQTVLDDCEKINMRIFAVDCYGSMNLLNRGAYFPGGTVRTASWCKSNLPCATFPYSLAIGGNPEPGDIPPSQPINVQVYALKAQDCSLVPIQQLSLAQPGSVFAVAWIPETDCAHLTVAGGCLPDFYCLNNLFSYKIVLNKVHSIFEFDLVSQSKFDETITSMAWCHIGSCSYLLVGSEGTFWDDPHKSILCKNPDEVALYKGSFARTVGSPGPLCQRSIPFDEE